MAGSACCAALLVAIPASAQSTLYLDLDAGAGFGTNAHFNWDTSSANWNFDSSGVTTATPWQNNSPGYNAVLGTGTGSGSYTATLTNSITVGGISATNGTWAIALGSNTLTFDSSSNSTLTQSISGAGSVVKSGSGSIALTAMNNFTGGISIAGGAVIIGTTVALSPNAPLTLAGGTLQFGGAYIQPFLSGLNLTANSQMDFGNGMSSSQLSFGNSSSLTWSGTLTISNFNSGSDTLRFGSSATAITSGQLALINFNGIGAQIDGNGFVTPIPEPGTYALLFGSGALAAAIYRRRNRAANSARLKSS